MDRKDALVASAAAAVLALASSPAVFATTNFCGTSWGDASSNCDARQPCPSGTDQECTSGGVCWADTDCNTAEGHGILFDKGHPSHMRFCGISWNDASDNCSVERHCPSGEDDECPGDEECYSFLGCNYVDLIGGPAGAASLNSGGGNPDRLDGDHPSRTNFCGYGWENANTGCDEDHWCPSGADADCPSGMTCYAGTECKYDADLVPTGSPSEKPTGAPSPAPIVYNTKANTSFCSDKWEDARNTCRIASHCPSGSDADCPGTQTCYSWMTPCNIIDFRNYLDEHGVEIMGAEKWLVPDDWVEENDSTPQLPPADIVMPTPAVGLSAPQPAPSVVSPPAAELPQSMTPRPTSGQPTVHDLDKVDPQNHVFCGRTWTDAAERCSPETFCADGAHHKCDNPQDHCWVGIDACNAATFGVEDASVPALEPTTTDTPSPTSKVINLPTFSESDVTEVVEAPTHSEDNQGGMTGSGGDSYCAKTYLQLVQNCANLKTCSSSKPCPDRYSCFSNYKCPGAASKPTPATAPPTPRPTQPPVTRAPVTDVPTGSPVTAVPTHSPTIFSLSDEEIAQRLTNMNSYCAASYAEVLASCSYALHTCNPGDMTMCPPGTNCFENIICPDSALVEAPATAESIPSPTPKPVFTTENAVMTGQNYCSTSLEELQRTCATAPTCNDGDGLCPSGTFCFGNHVCDAEAASEAFVMTASPTPPPTSEPITSTPTAKPSSEPTNSIPVSVDKPNAAVADSQASAGQNYCAKSAVELETTCAAAPTCNDGDGPCPNDTFCFPNVVCESAGQAAEPLPPAPPVEDTVVYADTPTSDPACNALCLQPLSYSDCQSALDDGVEIFSCTSPEVIVGDVCAATGQCGTDFELKNCPDDLSVYIRVLPSMCKEQGLVNGSGVIPATTIVNAEEDSDSDEGSSGFDASDLPIFGFGGLQDEETETSSDVDSGTAGEDETESWDSWAKGGDGAKEDDEYGLGDWWTRQENAAFGRFGAWMSTRIALMVALAGLVLII
ncbi:hypothetical protein ACHAXT_011627 [Thalassiosira profunda]